MSNEAAPAEMPVEVVTERAAPSTAMTVREERALEPFGGAKQFPLAVLSDDEFTELLARMRSHYNRMKDVQRSLMVPGVHYGIPGKKPNEVAEAIKGDGTKVGIYKAGMELLLKLHRYVADVKQVVTYGDPGNEETPAIRVDSVCHVHADSLEGPIIAVGVGSANSWETKYRYRNAQRKCPACGAAALMLSKYEAKGGPFKGLKPWWCNSKGTAGGCGAEFAPDDKRITEQEMGKVANGEAFDLENTLVKMSAKRAKVDGTITATGSSDLFTQDLEDMSPEVRARVEREVAAGADATVRELYGPGAEGDGDPEAWRDAPTGERPAGDPGAAPAPNGRSAAASAPSRASGSGGGTDGPRQATDKQRGALRALLAVKLGARGAGEQDAALGTLGAPGTVETITMADASVAIAKLNGMPDAPKPAAAAPAPSRAATLTEQPAGPAPAKPIAEVEGPLADTKANRDWLIGGVRNLAEKIEANWGGRKVLSLDDGIWFIVGGNEMAVLKISKPCPLEYLDIERLTLLGNYLKGELARKGISA